MGYGNRKSDAELEQRFIELCREAAKDEKYLWYIFAAILVVTARIFHSDLEFLQAKSETRQDSEYALSKAETRQDPKYVLSEAETQMFQSRMREFKKARGLTNKEIGDKLGVSPTTIQGILDLNESTAKDSFPIREEYVLNLCYCFSISPNYLFGETDDIFEIQIRNAEEREQYLQMLVDPATDDETEKPKIDPKIAAAWEGKDLVFPIIQNGTNYETIKAMCAISNIICTGKNVCEYSVETIRNYIETFARLSSLGEKNAREVSSKFGATAKAIKKKVDFQKDFSKRRTEYIRFVIDEYKEIETFLALEDKIIDNLRHQTKEYCDVVCAVASLDQSIVFSLLDQLKENYLPRKYEKKNNGGTNKDNGLYVHFLP